MRKFEISEPAAYWHELMIPALSQRTLRSSTACPGQPTTGPAVQPSDIHFPNQQY